MTKVRFPRALITIATMGGDVLTGLAMLIVAIVTSVVVTGGAHPSLVLLPVLVVFLAMLTVGFGLIVAPVQVYFRDVEHIMAAVGLPWIFLSPVFYTFATAPGLQDSPLLEAVLHWGNPRRRSSSPSRTCSSGGPGRAPATCSTRVSPERSSWRSASASSAGWSPRWRPKLMVAAAPGEIRLDNVARRYRLVHQRNRTLKETALRRKRVDASEVWALRGVDLHVKPGEAVGVIGRNGSGKSTLLKLAAGIMPPNGGEVAIGGRVASMLELGAGFHPDFSGRENVFMNGTILGLSDREIEERFDDIVRFSELGEFVEQPVRTYSSGMYMRLAFSVASHVDPDVLLLDEVLAVGDEAFQRKCLGRMFEFRRRGGTLCSCPTTRTRSSGSATAPCCWRTGGSWPRGHLRGALGLPPADDARARGRRGLGRSERGTPWTARRHPHRPPRPSRQRAAARRRRRPPATARRASPRCVCGRVRGEHALHDR